uniref:Calmodulin n=1 Tax=Lygus hesperus TaxID=30085 RepID=A0A0A9WHQ5_LYGHE
MPFMSRTLRAISHHERTIEKIRNMYITKRPSRKVTHKHLNDKEIESAQTTFKYFDKNKDKVWNLGEFKEYVKWTTNYGVHRDEKIGEVFESIDTDKNKLVDFNEFLDYGSLKKLSLPSEQHLEELFSKCDINEDGLIGLEELRQILLLLGEDLTRYENLRRAYAHYDKDNDGLINVYEFLKFVTAETDRSQSTVKK